MRPLFFAFCLIHSLYAGLSDIDIVPENVKRETLKVRILDQKELRFSSIDGICFSEISDLAYSAKEDLLFMVSDEGGLFTFTARFNENVEVLTPLSGTRLRKKGGTPFLSWRRDSEGMTLDGHNRLLISFEGKAKIAWFHKNSSRYGALIRKYRLPKILRKSSDYRSKNKELEALAWHPRYGILTATEWPLRQDSMKRQTIYALSGKRWHFNAEPETNSAVTAIEVMDDGNLLVLERAFVSFFEPFVVTLKKVFINSCSRQICRSEVLLKMNTHQGWHIDNFEGLARVGKKRYLMVSDNNNNFFQRTLLIYFEVTE